MNDVDEVITRFERAKRLGFEPAIVLLISVLLGIMWVGYSTFKPLMTDYFDQMIVLVSGVGKKLEDSNERAAAFEDTAISIMRQNSASIKIVSDIANRNSIILELLGLPYNHKEESVKRYLNTEKDLKIMTEQEYDDYVNKEIQKRMDDKMNKKGYKSANRD